MQNHLKKHLLAILSIIIFIIITIPLYFINEGPTPAGVSEYTDDEILGKGQKESDKTPFIITGDLSDFKTQDPFQPVYDNFTISQRQNQGLSTALPKIEPYYHEKTVYLTFDDGPNDDIEIAILDILKQEQVKATFFLLGNKLHDYPDVVKRIYNENHAIGNHSYTHIYEKLYDSPGSYIKELQQADDIFKEILGVRPLITRAPGGIVGNFTDEYWLELERLGYIEVGWNISSGDASDGTAEDLIDNIIHQLDNFPILQDHAIILMHSSPGHEETIKALPQIIKILKERGFAFGVITPSTPPAWENKKS